MPAELVHLSISAGVADALAQFREAGVGSFTPQLGWPFDKETVELLIGPVAERLGAGERVA